MSSNYRCEFFDIKELVDKETCGVWGDAAWMFLRTETLISLDNIRRYFDKPVTVNDWMFGGQMQFRGFRPPHSTVGASLSQHRFGNAFDFDIKGVSAETVRQEIIRLKDDPLFLSITCMEIGTVYVHFDCRNIPDRIRLINP